MRLHKQYEEKFNKCIQWMKWQASYGFIIGGRGWQWLACKRWHCEEVQLCECEVLYYGHVSFWLVLGDGALWIKSVLRLHSKWYRIFWINYQAGTMCKAVPTRLLWIPCINACCAMTAECVHFTAATYMTETYKNIYYLFIYLNFIYIIVHLNEQFSACMYGWCTCRVK